MMEYEKRTEREVVFSLELLNSINSSSKFDINLDDYVRLSIVVILIGGTH